MVSSTTIVALDLFEDTGGLGNLQSKRRCLALNTISVPANVPAFSPTSADPFVSAALSGAARGAVRGVVRGRVASSGCARCRVHKCHAYKDSDNLLCTAPSQRKFCGRHEGWTGRRKNCS